MRGRFDEEPLDGLDGAVDQRQPLPVAREHAAHHLGGDLVGLVGHAELLVQVARPFVRAHAHHRALCLLVVAAAALEHERSAHLVPDLLRLDEHAVQVEHDRLDRHPALRYSPPTYVRPEPARPSSIESTSATKKV